jgi:hypothetical protein
MNRKKHQRERGAALMETTLILPIFLMFWFGIVDWGIAFFAHQTVVYNTNAAARWAVVNDFDAAKIAAMVMYQDPNSTSTSAPWWSIGGPPNVDAQLLGSAATRDKRVQITVSNYQWMHFTPYFAGKYLGAPVTVVLPSEDLKTGI